MLMIFLAVAVAKLAVDDFRNFGGDAVGFGDFARIKG